MLLENENLALYDAERKFINSPYNKLSFYIPGKGITLDEDGNIRFYPLPDIDEFVYGQDIEPEYLFDEYQLTFEEKDIIKKLQGYNEILNEQNISVVYMRSEKEEIFLFLIAEKCPETFYKIAERDIGNLSLDKLPNPQVNTITTAKYIKF